MKQKNLKELWSKEKQTQGNGTDRTDSDPNEEEESEYTDDLQALDPAQKTSQTIDKNKPRKQRKKGSNRK